MLNTFHTIPFTPASAAVLLLALLFTFVIVLTWRYLQAVSPAEQPQPKNSAEVRQPVLDSDLTDDPDQVAHVHARMYDTRARKAKRWNDRLELASGVLAPLSIAVAATYHSLGVWAVALVTIVANVSKIKKFSKTWISQRRTFHRTSNLILRRKLKKIGLEEFTDRLLDIIESEQKQFGRIARRRRKVSPEHKSSGQPEHH